MTADDGVGDQGFDLGYDGAVRQYVRQVGGAVLCDTMSTVKIRPLENTEEKLLQIATLGNMNWCGERFSMAAVLEDPSIVHYTRLDLERGDFGFVMEEAEPVGVVWALFLGSSDPGYGYLADDIPELSIWVSPDHRGGGNGRRLLRALLAECTRRGHVSVSLSVEDGNPARDLYASEDFVAVPGREKDGVMGWDGPR